MKALLLVVVVGVMVAASVAVWNMRDDSELRENQNPVSDTAKVEEVSGLAEAKRGMFSGVAPKAGSGSVMLTENPKGRHTLELGEDFKVQEGPDLYVGFGNSGEVDKETLFSTLDKFNGTQNYTVPENIDVTKYAQAFIYCKEFSVVFAVAPLQ